MMNLLNNKQITKTAKHHTASNKKEIFQKKSASTIIHIYRIDLILLNYFAGISPIET